MTKNGKIYQIFKSHFQINFVQINWVFGCLGYFYRILFFKVWSNGYFLGMTTKVFLEHNALTVYFYWKNFFNTIQTHLSRRRNIFQVTWLLPKILSKWNLFIKSTQDPLSHPSKKETQSGTKKSLDFQL